MLDLGDTEPEDEGEVRTPTGPRRSAYMRRIGDEEEFRREPSTASVAAVQSTPPVVVVDHESNEHRQSSFDEDMMDAALALCGLGRKP